MESIAWEDQDGVRWIHLEGELDNEACLDLRERFDRAVREVDGDVVVGLGGVTFMSSMAVGLLLKAREVLDQRKHSLRISSPSDSVRRILQLMNLTDVFEEA